MASIGNRLEPARYSVEEAEFLVKNVGKPPVVAMQQGTPEHVNPKAVRPVLERVFELMQLEEHEGQEWAGLDAVRDCLTVYVENIKQWQADKKKGAPYPPTMYEWDGRGRARQYAVGADAGFANTYFDDQGNRHKLGLALTGGVEQRYVPEFIRKRISKPTPTALIIDEQIGRIECPVCQYVVNFNPEDPTKINIAKAAMGKHMLKDTRNPDDHKAVYGAIFGTGGREVS